MLCIILNQNIAAIVATAQALDGLFAQFLFGSSWAMQIYPILKPIHWEASECEDEAMCIPFEGDGTLILTAGYILTAVALIPFGLQQLKDNMAIQKISFVFLVALCLHFFWVFYQQGMQSENLTWFGSNYSHLIGTLLLGIVTLARSNDGYFNNFCFCCSFGQELCCSISHFRSQYLAGCMRRSMRYR